MKKLFSDARETSVGTVVTVHELPDIEGEKGLVISGINTSEEGGKRYNICFRVEAAIVLSEMLNDWKSEQVDD